MILETETVIHATSKRVWDILTDFRDYPNRGTFIKSIEGQVVKGSRIKVSFDNMNFKPKVLCYDPGKKLEWIGRLLLPGLFDGRHAFLIDDNGDGSITFKHYEKFTGALVPLYRRKLRTEIKTHFEQFNTVIKELAEDDPTPS